MLVPRRVRKKTYDNKLEIGVSLAPLRPEKSPTNRFPQDRHVHTRMDRSSLAGETRGWFAADPPRFVHLAKSRFNKHDLEPSENNHPTQNIHDLGLKIHVKFFPGFETKFVRQCDFSHEKLENWGSSQMDTARELRDFSYPPTGSRSHIPDIPQKR